MNKRIISFLLCFCMLFGMIATALPVYAAGTLDVYIEPDKEEAVFGETVNFTVSVGPVENLQSVNFTLVIPDGLTYVEGNAIEGLKELLGATEASYVDASKTMFVGGGGSYTSSNNTPLMTFSCTVSGDVGNEVSVAFDGTEDFADNQYTSYDINLVSGSVNIIAAPVHAIGVTINHEALQLDLVNNKTAQLTAIVEPSGATDDVVWESSDNTVATVDDSGNVTAVGVGSATIKATAGSAFDTCAVTVSKATIPTSAIVAPVKKDGLSYNTNAQALVTGGNSPAGTTMMYAVTTENTEPSANNFTTDVPKGTAAGTYYVWYYVAGGANYADTAVYGPIEVSIAKGTPDVPSIPTGLTATYGDTLADVTLPDGWTWKDALTTSVGNAGTNEFTAVFTHADPNYKAVEQTVSVTVGKADPEYTVPENLTATYGDTLANVMLPNGWTWKDALTTSVGNVGTNEFTAVFTPADPNNYNTVEKTVSVEVGQATPEYTVPENLTATYGDTLADVPLVNYSGWSWKDSATSVGDVGTKTFTAVYTPADNNYKAVEVELTVTVNKQKVAIPAEDNTVYIYNGSEQTYYVAANAAYEVSGNKETNAGTYEVKVTLKDTTNYEWADGSIADLTYDFVIAKAQVTMPVDDTTVYTYNGSEQTYVLTECNMYTISGNKKTDAGTYTVTVALRNEYAGNIEWTDGTTDALEYTFTIGRKDVTVTADAKSKVYGEADPALTYIATGLVGSETLNGALSRAEGNAVGTYSINQGTVTNENNPNYNISYTQATFTITPAEQGGFTITGTPVGNVVYGAEFQLSTTGGQGTGEITWEVTSGTAYATIDTDGTVNIIGVGDVKITATKASDGNYSEATAVYSFTSVAAESAVDQHPTAVSGLTYTGGALTLITEGTANGGEMQYSLDGVTFSAGLPSAVNAGDYTVYYKVKGDANHNDSDVESVDVNIAKANIDSSDYTAPTAVSGLVYIGTAQNLVNPGDSDVGTMQYSLIENGEFSATIPTGIGAGDYTVYYKVKGDANHNDSDVASVNVNIAKATPSVTAPTANSLTYTGSELTLIAAGSTTGGTMQYAIGENGTTAPVDGWNADPSKGTDAGTYYVWYKVDGGSNNNDVAPVCVTVEIAKATPTVEAPVALSGLVHTGSELTLINAGSTSGGEMQYAIGENGTTAPTDGWNTNPPKGTDAGEYFVWYKVVGDKNYNDVAPACVKVTIAEAGSTTVPVTGVSLDKNGMTLTVGSSDTLTATVAPDDATNKAVSWSSSNTAVATVDQNGNVTAVGVGTATIMVTTAEGGFTATCTVTVTAAGGTGGGSTGGGHYWHYDYNSDGKCDGCGGKISCKHTDANKDGYCDSCYRCMNHKDKNGDAFCDSCGNKIVESSKTFDGGIALYIGMSIAAATGSAALVVSKKRKSK